MIDKVDDHKEVEQDLALINYKFDKCMNFLQNLYFEHQNQLFSLDSIERKRNTNGSIQKFVQCIQNQKRIWIDYD